MRFLFVQTHGSQIDIPRVLEEMGHNCDCLFNFEFDANDLSENEGTATVERALCGTHYDYIISYFFLPVVSEVCERNNTLYISWVYDSPQLAVYHPSILNPVNRVFLFDRCEAERLKSLDIPHIYYMPLAADMAKGNSLKITNEDRQKYSCDISFVGTLYEDNSYNRIGNKLPSDIKENVSNYVNSCFCKWDNPRTWPAFSSDEVERLRPFFDDKKLSKFEMPMEYYYAHQIASLKLGETERVYLLEELGKKFKVDFFTRNTSYPVKNVRIHPSLDYYNELGKVYYLSKINLAFTLPTIETGVPLRVFDIMGHNGFVLSNLQDEIGELFEIGRDIAVFRNAEELMELAGYYLTHEKERKKIATNGRNKVNNEHSLKTRLQQIIDICRQES